MPLYIRDDSVDGLAEKVMKATGAKTKTDAVRAALLAQLEAIRKKTPLIDTVRALQDRVDCLGEADPAFDQKAFSDEMWEDSDVH